jgi:deoxyribodipyrimidine photolyase-related protein
MALFADGGVLASKPYTASGAYIDRISDYCSDCAYSPKTKLGPGACPFNYLYWNFLIVNEAKLKTNPRMTLPYRTLDGMRDERREEIATQAWAFLEAMASGPVSSASQ